jgi:tRNA-(ms[2]io[6]A)-hydroxylase
VIDWDERLPLRAATPAAWLEAVTGDLGAFLLDHAACERKAAALCLSMVSRFTDWPVLIEPLISLAREELEHFLQVHRLLARRGLALGADPPDPYAAGLLKAVRHPRDTHLLDRLIVASLIEARSCERFLILARRLPEHGEPELACFYADLARSEAGHHKVFLRLAERCGTDPAQVDAALDRFLAIEADVMLASPVRPAVH